MRAPVKPLRRSQLSKERISSFISRTRQSDSGCIEWIGSVSGSVLKYGRFCIGKLEFKSHRVSWVINFGEIPEGMLVCHHCDNPICVNPDHLFIGDHFDNQRDCQKKFRRKFNTNPRPSTQGEKHVRAKITTQDVLEIRELRSNGYTYKDLAKKFNLGKTTISHITKKRNWKHV